MSGHEGNTQSVTARCMFFLSLITTIYWLLVLSDIWPREAEKVLLSLQKIQGKPDASSVDINSLNTLLAKLDYHYTHEINVDHHDEVPSMSHESDEQHKSTSSDPHASLDQLKEQKTLLDTLQPQQQQGQSKDELAGLREPFTEPPLKIEIPPTVAAVVRSQVPSEPKQSTHVNAKVIDLDDWQDDLDLDGLLD